MKRWGRPEPWGPGAGADPGCDRRGYHHGNLKEALVDAARRFIAERGIGGFTLADAAKLVGVTPAALYRHFRGREALVQEVAFRGFDQLAERLARALSGSGTPLERFTRMGEAYLDFAEKEPGYYAAMFAAPSEETAGAAPPAPWGQPRSPFGMLVESLGKAFPDGFGAVDPRFVALEVWALAHGLATLDAARMLPRGPGLPGKHELLRAGVLAVIHGTGRK
ncbi:TetR/AcrR family transcriptional regulator [Enterovirga rhinocerotis]|uniref:TetR family transcriptional regulator n=1 Tax=Enterovirga rhinocerotis TaxID=1339210 RepID=A0A4R7BX63_9HYPH|nr:TetR/AcrR family transcriptional regulator [Enterovirga rhinocerotis]TDR90171.1 TetR family transcriptional regulator [Enterovirga rhinocerotis]